jgi:uncharacterized protein HemX
MATRKTAAKGKPAAKKAAAKQPATRKLSAAKAPAAKAKPKVKPAPNMGERMEGLQGWMAEIERKQSRMTRFGGLAAILAIAAAGGALALGIMNQQDAATKDDVDELQQQVETLSGEIEKQTEKQLGTLNQKITGFEGRIASLEKQQKQNAATIATLQSQANTAKRGAAVPTTPALPGVTP